MQFKFEKLTLFTMRNLFRDKNNHCQNEAAKIQFDCFNSSKNTIIQSFVTKCFEGKMFYKTIITVLK